MALNAIVAGCAGTSSEGSTALASAEGATIGTKTAIDEYILGIMDELAMAGVQAAVVKDGSVAWMNAYGSAVLAPLPEAPMTVDTIFNIGSVSKMLVGLAVMQQVEQGALALDDDLATGLPWPVRNPAFPDVPITWRMVLTHTSSIVDDGAVYNGTYYWGMDCPVALSSFMNDLFAPAGAYQWATTFDAEAPGTASIYSNFAIALAAYALEVRVGQPFHEYIRERILEPLGMAQTSYFLADLPVEQLGVPYQCNRHRDGERVCNPIREAATVLDSQYSFPDYPDGLLRTSVRDYAKLVEMLLNGGSVRGAPLIQPSSLDQLLSAQLPELQEGITPGLIFFGVDLPADGIDAAVWGHTGIDYGVASAVFFDPVSGAGALAFSNSQDVFEANDLALLAIVERLLLEFH